MGEILSICCCVTCIENKMRDGVRIIENRGNKHLLYYSNREIIEYKKAGSFRMAINRIKFILADDLDYQVRGKVFDNFIICEAINLSLSQYDELQLRLKACTD